MKTSLSHLPDEKKKQITAITSTIIDVIQPEKIILFGSYAKGEYVEDKYIENGITYEYISDYDFLVVTKDSSVKEHIISDKIVNRFHFHTPINIVAQDIDYVNHGLSFGQYFFTDIIKEGILVYDTQRFEFSELRTLTYDEEKQRAKEYFDVWFNMGSEFLIDASNALNRGSLNISAFYLHQATESFFNTTLLVFTGYKPKTHSLDKLRNYCKLLSKDLYALFSNPASEESEKHLFELLKKGYIDARYKSNYNIDSLQAEEILRRIIRMRVIVENICKEKVNGFD